MYGISLILALLSGYALHKFFVWRMKMLDERICATIQPDEIWVMSSGDPWPTKHEVRILDVKQGWVRYAFSGSSVYQDLRMKAHTFVHIYQKKDERPQE